MKDIFLGAMFANVERVNDFVFVILWIAKPNLHVKMNTEKQLRKLTPL